MPEQFKTLYSVTGDIKDINTLLVPRAKQMSPSGDMPEDFEEGQRWLKELDAMAKDGTPDQKRAVAVVRNLMAAAKEQQPQATLLPLDTAPKDGTIIRLLVDFEHGNLEDSPEPQWTIGGNCADNTGVDQWQFAGWDWSHDCFCEGAGKVLGWLPMLDAKVVQHRQLTELQKDAVPLLLALCEAWTYVHAHCTIKSRKDEIQRLIAKHGDFAEFWKDQLPKPFGYVSQHTNGSWEFSPTAAGVYPDTAKSITAVYAKQPQAEDTIKRQAQKIAELTADRDGWIEAHARLHREYHDFRKAAPQQAEAVHSYVLELPDGDARQAKVCWSDRNEANGEIRHHLCISVVAAPQQAEAALQWCQDCGEGYVNFCRVKSADCKMKPKAE